MAELRSFWERLADPAVRSFEIDTRGTRYNAWYQVLKQTQIVGRMLFLVIPRKAVQLRGIFVQFSCRIVRAQFHL